MLTALSLIRSTALPIATRPSVRSAVVPLFAHNARRFHYYRSDCCQPTPQHALRRLPSRFRRRVAHCRCPRKWPLLSVCIYKLTDVTCCLSFHPQSFSSSPSFSRDMARMTLIGRLGAAPERRQTRNGKDFVIYKVATTDPYIAPKEGGQFSHSLRTAGDD